MKIITISIISTLMLLSCNSLKTTKRILNSGNYNIAILNATKKLIKNKKSKKAQKYIPILKTAFQKAIQQDNKRISFLIKENNPENLEEVYETYQRMQQRQKRLKPLLPLHNYSNNKKAIFNLVSYDNEILKYKSQLSLFLYNKSKTALQKSTNKYDFRKTFEDLNYLEKINSNYQNTRVIN